MVVMMLNIKLVTYLRRTLTFYFPFTLLTCKRLELGNILYGSSASSCVILSLSILVQKLNLLRSY